MRVCIDGNLRAHVPYFNGDFDLSPEAILRRQMANVGAGAWNAVRDTYLKFTELSLFAMSADLGGAALAARGSTTLYRAVSIAEHADIAASGVLRAGPNSIETGKWFAESAAHARQWGTALEGAGNFRVIEATFPRSAADQFLRNPLLDNIGPARFGTFEQMGNPIITVLPGP